MQHEVRSLVTSWYKAARDTLVAPPFCAYCKKFLNKRDVFCIDCYQLLEPVVSRAVPISTQLTMHVMAVGIYREPLKSIILAKAWSDIVACKQLGSLIWDHTYFRNIPCDFLVPIPLHWLRFARRGYNQAEEIARELGVQRKVPIAPLLKRIRHTPFQSSLIYTQRAANVKSVFALKEINSASYQGKHIVLVDDLMTTGATLVSAAKVLLPLKPASIHAVVVARAI